MKSGLMLFYDGIFLQKYPVCLFWQAGYFFADSIRDFLQQNGQSSSFFVGLKREKKRKDRK